MKNYFTNSSMNDDLPIKKKRTTAYRIHFLLILLFIYISDDTVLFGTNANRAFANFKYIYIMISAVVFFIIVLGKNHSVIQKKCCYYIIALIGLIFSSMLVNADVRLGYFYKVCLLLYAYSLTQLIGLEEFAQHFTRIIYILALCSLIGYAVLYINPALLTIFPRVKNIASAFFYNAGVFISPLRSGELLRNYGIFREPGVYQMFLIMALLFQMYIIRTNSLLRYIVYIAAIITTMSTTGYIALGVVMFLFIFNQKDLATSKRIILILLVLICVVLLTHYTNIFSLSLDDARSSVFVKLKNENSASRVARFASITENLRMALEKPFLGVGLTALGDKFPTYAKLHYGIRTVHNTNTVLIQFAAHGLLYGFLWCIAYWKFARTINKKYCLIVFITIIILYIGENLTFSGFASLFLMYGITSEGSLSLDERNRKNNSGD